MKYFRFAVLLVCALLAVFALGQFAAALNQGELLRPASLTGNPNNLAIVMVGALLLALRGRHVALSILFGVVLLLTQSLTGYLAAAAALFVVDTSEEGTPLWAYLVVLPLHLGIAMVMLASFGRATSSLEYRFELWGLAWSQLVAHPIVGIGATALGDYLAAHDSVAPLPIHAHNLYLQVGAAWGVLGAIVFCVMGLTAGRLALRARELHAAAFLLAVLVGGLGDYIFWFWPMIVLIPVLFGALLIPAVDLILGTGTSRPAARSRIPLRLPDTRPGFKAEHPQRK